MKPEEFDMVMKVHMYGTFAVCHAAWPIMREQEYGRIVNITSVNGLYGQFGQANYSAAKMGIVGFSKTLAQEGEKRNIKVNVVKVQANRPQDYDNKRLAKIATCIDEKRTTAERLLTAWSCFWTSRHCSSSTKC